MSLNILGPWVKSLGQLKATFADAKPYEHVLIPNFFTEEHASKLAAEFPDPVLSTCDWKHYDNPIEQKYALNNFQELPSTKLVFETLQCNEVVNLVREVTGILDLEADPFLHGAGLHAYPSGGKLDVHLDYQIHPLSGKERRINLIVYLNRVWDPEWGGALQLWNAERTECITEVNSGWNEAVVFKTSDLSYHGLPRPLGCPQGTFRRSLAVYYVSSARPDVESRPKAQFFPDPKQSVCPRLAALYEIRKTRLVSKKDLENWPQWRQEGAGWW